MVDTELLLISLPPPGEYLHVIPREVAKTDPARWAVFRTAEYYVFQASFEEEGDGAER